MMARMNPGTEYDADMVTRERPRSSDGVLPALTGRSASPAGGTDVARLAGIEPTTLGFGGR